jgi:nucleoside 2-deoxyribosyltransferase
MTQPIRIYLAGKVAKGEEVGSALDWRNQYIEVLKGAGAFDFISPEDPSLDESKPVEVFGHDCYQVKSCDIVVTNASTKLGAGTAQEMVIAKYFVKPVLTILPKDTHHRRTNLMMNGITVPDWIHPFIYAMSDGIFESVSELSTFLGSQGAALTQMNPRGISFIDAAIREYLTSKRS